MEQKFKKGPWEKSAMHSYNAGHITNNRGVGFSLHGSTNQNVKQSLCRYLDKLESDRAGLLESLKNMVELKELADEDGYIEGVGSVDVDHLLKTARAAIAEAEGR